MSDTNPFWEQVGISFVQHYYHQFDNDRSLLGALYLDSSCLSWEGEQCRGKVAIVEKLLKLPFRKIAHSITAQDHQPTPDGCILSVVVGQLKADEDQILGFHQTFLLKNLSDVWADEDQIIGFHQTFILKSIDESWVCTNDIFRLALYNFG